MQASSPSCSYLRAGRLKRENFFSPLKVFHLEQIFSNNNDGKRQKSIKLIKIYFYSSLSCESRRNGSGANFNVYLSPYCFFYWIKTFILRHCFVPLIVYSSFWFGKNPEKNLEENLKKNPIRIAQALKININRGKSRWVVQITLK